VRRQEGEDGYLTTLTTVGGTIYAALALAALAINQWHPDDERRHLQHNRLPRLIHAANDASYVLHRDRRSRCLGDDHRGLALGDAAGAVPTWPAGSASSPGSSRWPRSRSSAGRDRAL
jgi:hypothetical protein